MSRFPIIASARQSCRSLCFGVSSLLFAVFQSAGAADVPQTVQLPTGLNTGGTSFLDGFSRTDPGWAYLQYARYYHLDAIKDARGNDVPVFRDPHIDSTVLISQFSYTSSQKLFGGLLGFNTIVPLVNLDASFAADSPVSLRDNGFGVGDVTLGPYLQMMPVIRDGRPVFIQRFELNAIVPAGKFSRDRDLNQSAGYWSAAANWAFTVLPTPNWEISARVNYVYNFRADEAPNPPPLPGFAFRNGRAGDAAWVNFASSYALSPAFRLGVNGYYLKQLSDNRTNGKRVPDTRQTQFYLGPGGSWQIDRHNILNANVYVPVNVRNAAAGNNINFQYIHVF